MTTEEKARAYAEKKTENCVSEHYGSMMMRRRVERFDSYDIEQAYEDGAAEALASQWVRVEERLPEEKKPVLCFMADMKDPYAENDSYFDMAMLLEGEFINLDAEIVHPSYWMPIPIPPLKGGDS